MKQTYRFKDNQDVLYTLPGREEQIARVVGCANDIGDGTKTYILWDNGIKSKEYPYTVFVLPECYIREI